MNSFRLQVSDEQTIQVSVEDRQVEVLNEISRPGSRSVNQISFTVGDLTAPPQYADGGGAVILVFETSTGEHQVKIEGSSMETGSFEVDRDALMDLPAASS